MSRDYGVLFPASVVGSMPRSEFVKDLISDNSTVSPELYEKVMGTAVSYVVALQEHAGLDIITDGEWWRKSYIGVVAELAHGFELSRAADGRPWTVVVDKIEAKNTGFIAKEIRYLKTITNKMIKATLPAPALLGERMWDPELSKKAYPTREEFVRACVPILRAELELLKTEGVTIVQIDDPHLCLFVDQGYRDRYESADAAASFDVETINELVDGVDGLKTAVHLCRRAGARARGEARYSGGYEPIIDQLNALAVDHLTLEFTAPEAGDMAIFSQLRSEFEIGLGCVGTEPGKVDPVEAIVSRVEKALKYLTPERITLNPDCGFAPGSAAKVSIDEVYQKLKNEVTAAERLRERHG